MAHHCRQSGAGCHDSNEGTNVVRSHFAAVWAATGTPHEEPTSESRHHVTQPWFAEAARSSRLGLDQPCRESRLIRSSSPFARSPSIKLLIMAFVS